MPSTNTSGRSAGPAADANRLSAAERWLLAAATDPRAIRDRWDRDGVALLPCDALFAAIRIPAAIVHAAAGTTDPAELPGILARLLGGAVFLDPQEGHFYALVEPAAARRWTVEGSVCLWGPEAYLGVPAPERTTGAGSAGAHWAVSPDCLGRRCNSVDVAVLVRAGFTSGHEQVVIQGAVAGDRTVPVEQAFAESLGRVPESAAEARHLVAAALKAWSLPQLVEDAELVMTELVSNAVAHTAGECIRVNVLRLSDRRVRISVADRDRKRPTRREPDVCGERGRGLLLVEACSSKWGVRVLPGGKAVWSELEAAP